MAVKVWQKISEQTLAAGFGKEFRNAVFRNPLTGEDVDFKLIGQKDWSVVLPVTEDRMVLSVVQFKQGANKIMRELPAGTVDFSKELPVEVARRELREETGYALDEVIFLGPPQYIASRSSWTRFHCFLALGCVKVAEAKLDSIEDIEVELVPLARWIDMAQKEIEEPSALVTTFKSLPYLVQRFGKEVTRCV